MLDTLKCEEQSVLVNYNVVEGICASGSECSGPLTVSYALSVHRVEWLVFDEQWSRCCQMFQHDTI